MAAILIVFLYLGGTGERATVPGGLQRMMLSQKDRDFAIIPPALGGATGSVWYSPRGTALSFRLQASGLHAGRRYLLELSVDGTVYTVASHVADASGEIAIDSTITTFAEGVCVGDNFDRPTPASGAHEVEFWMKNDGNPASGTMPGRKRTSEGGSALPCHGNGDGNYDYVLLNDGTASFIGE